MIFDNLLALIIKRRLKKMKKKMSEGSIEDIYGNIANIKMSIVEKVKKYRYYTNLKKIAANSPYYKNEVAPLIKGLHYTNAYSIHHQLPFTTPKDIQEQPEKFLAIPESEIAAYHFTAGTTGARKTVYVSKFDLDLITYMYSLGFINLNVTKQDVAQVMYSFGIWQLGGLLANALRNIGVICLPTGNYLDFTEQQEYMEKFGVTVLAGTASYIYNLAHEVDLPSELKENMKAIMIGGEGLSQNRRQIIEEKLGGKVFMNYGMMEFGGGIGSECTCHDGYHIFPNVYHEIIDPKTKKPVAPGEYGELVLTSLAREAMPLIRYRTGDITREITEPCTCGLKLPKIDYIKGRVDDRIILGSAEKYYPKDFDEIFEPIQAIKDYQIIVTRANGKDLLKIHILTDHASEALRRKLLEEIYSITPLKIDIFQTKTIDVPEITFKNKFSNTKEKKPRIIDLRENS